MRHLMLSCTAVSQHFTWGKITQYASFVTSLLLAAFRQLINTQNDSFVTRYIKQYSRAVADKNETRQHRLQIRTGHLRTDEHRSIPRKLQLIQQTGTLNTSELEFFGMIRTTAVQQRYSRKTNQRQQSLVLQGRARAIRFQ